MPRIQNPKIQKSVALVMVVVWLKAGRTTQVPLQSGELIRGRVVEQDVDYCDAVLKQAEEVECCNTKMSNIHNNFIGNHN